MLRIAIIIALILSVVVIILMPFIPGMTSSPFFIVLEVAASAFFLIAVLSAITGITFKACPKCGSRNTRRQKGKIPAGSITSTGHGTERADVFTEDGKRIGHVNVPKQITTSTNLYCYSYKCKKCGKQFYGKFFSRWY